MRLSIRVVTAALSSPKRSRMAALRPIHVVQAALPFFLKAAGPFSLWSPARRSALFRDVL